MTIHVGSDATAVQETSLAVFTLMTLSPLSERVLPSVPKIVSLYDTSTPRPLWLTAKSWSAMRMTPLRGWTVVFGSAVSVTFAEPAAGRPGILIQDKPGLMIVHPTMSPVLTPTVNASPAAANS